MKGKRVWVVAGGLIVAAIVGTSYYRDEVDANVSPVTTSYYRDEVDANVSPVTTAEVSRGNVVSTVEATGTLEAVTTVEVGTQVSGTIKTLSADFNSRVHKGDVIAQLDPSLFDTQVAQENATLQRLQSEGDKARVQADDAEVKLRRARELSERQLIARSDLDAAESTARAAQAAVKSADAQITQARASLTQAQVNLSHTVIRAPIDGVVIARNVDVGQTVAASMQAPTLFVLAQDLTEMRVQAKIDESDIGKIESKQPVRFRVDAYPNETFVGTVSQVRLQPVVEQNVVSYVTVIDVPNKDLRLKPGMTAAVTIEIGRADDVLKVPNAALRFQPDDEVFAKLGQQPPTRTRGNGQAGGQGTTSRNGQSARADGRSSNRRSVWVLADGRLTRVPVEIGLSDGTQTAVVGELNEGAHIAIGRASPTPAPSAPTTSPLLPTGRRGGGRS